MQCSKPITLSSGLLVPCGRCLMCRMKKREEWALRLIHELTYNNDAMFITLTYDDEHLPIASNPFNEILKELELPLIGTLKKTDLQKFFKRLRKDCPGQKLSYFACGEYGDQTHRPHYHIILFGLKLNDINKKIVIDNWNKQKWEPFQIKKQFGLVEYHSCRYVAKYVTKQLSGKEEDRVYKQTGRENVFRLLSKGLGKDFALRNRDQILKDLNCKLRGKKNSIPRYYLKLFNLDEDKKNELKLNAYINECSRVGKIIGVDMPEIHVVNYLINEKDKYLQYKKNKKKIIQQSEKNINARNQLFHGTL